MKRLLSLFLALSILLSFAVSFAVETPANTGPKLIEDDTSISGTVRFWVPFKEEQGMGDMINAFNAVYPNITVELTAYNNNSEGNVALNTTLMSGGIDVLHSFELHNTYKRWESGLYKDITDEIAADGIDLMENWGSADYLYDGRIYTLPAGGRSFYVAINMDEWNAAGLGEIPAQWTWEEYLAACEKMTHGTDADKVYGGGQYQAVNSVYNCMYQVYGKNALYNAQGMSSADDPVIQKALNREVKAENVDGI